MYAYDPPDIDNLEAGGFRGMYAYDPPDIDNLEFMREFAYLKLEREVELWRI